MAWQDRIKKASYTGPSGKTFDFGNAWEKTEFSFDHQATVYRFPDKDGAEVQSLGVGEKRFPMEIFISGNDYDLSAAEFIEILEERGNGVLIHPMYGRKIVQPTNVKRADDPVGNGNQAVISVLFIESKKIAVQDTAEDIKKKIEEEQTALDQETPEEYAAQKKDDTAQDSANSAARFSRNFSSMDKFLEPFVQFNDEVNAFYKSVSLSLNNNLTNLIDKPLTLASQTLTLIKTPARIVQSLGLRIEGYQGLASELRDRATIKAITNDTRNSLLESRFMLSGCVSAMAETLLLQTFVTKAQALTAALQLQDFHALNLSFIEDEETKFQDSGLDLLLYGDSQESKTLTSIVELTSNFLALSAFDLKQEKIIVLARFRTILDLTFDLYGNIDDANLELLISANSLTEEEIILIPKGREIVYYA